jgi:hypothetical protein
MTTLPFLPDPQPQPSPFPIPMVPIGDELSWEYRRIVRNLRTEEAPSEAELNTLGADGWELTGLFADSPFLYLYLKRPV